MFLQKTHKQHHIKLFTYLSIFTVLSLILFSRQKEKGFEFYDLENNKTRYPIPLPNYRAQKLSSESSNFINFAQKPKPKFFIYNSPEFNWYKNCTKSHPKTFDTLKNIVFNSDDIYFLEQAENHPQRIFDPNLADIFVIPVLFGFYSGVNPPLAAKYKNILFHFSQIKKNGFKCGGNDYSITKMLEITAKALIESPYFQRNNGNDHLIVASHWRLATSTETMFNGKETKIWLEILRNITVGSFEVIPRNSVSFKNGIPARLSSVENRPWINPWRCTIITPYVDIGIHPKYLIDDTDLLNFKNWLNRPLDFFMIGKMIGVDMSHKNAYVTRRRLERIFENSEYFKDKKIIYARTIGDTVDPKNGLEACDENLCFRSIFDFEDQGHDRHQSRGRILPIKCVHCTATTKMTENYKNYLIQSKFSLIIHGDTPTTSRLYDAISNLQIPIILSPTIYHTGLPFLEKVPWYDFCIFVDPFLTHWPRWVLFRTQNFEKNQKLLIFLDINCLIF